MKVAYFFVPLIEPLGLPDGYVFEFSRSQSYEEWLARHAQGLHEPLGGDGRITVTSLKFWRASTDTDNPRGVITLFEVARRAFPKLPPAPASDMRVTVERTVVEMAVPLTDEDGDDAFTSAFDTGLDCLRAFQRAYHVACGKYPLTLASRERMPIAVPLAVRDTDGDEGGWPSELSMFLLNSNVYEDTRLPDASEAQLDQLPHAASGVSEGRVFYGYSEGVREAQIALDRDGDYRAAVLSASMAAETLLDDLLAHAMWEEAIRPEDAAATFDGYLVTRVKRDYQVRFGGDWSLTGKGAMAAWYESLAKLRNRIIHAGYEPTQQQAATAWTALMGLESFVTDRLASDTGLRKSPRTAVAMMGRPGLQQRGKWSRRLRTLVDDPDEPNWAETFSRWRASMNRCRSEGKELAETPDSSRAFVLRCVLPGGHAYWCAHDRLASLAAVLPDPPDGAIPAQQLATLEKTLAVVRSQPLEEPVSTALLEIPVWSEPDEWHEEYLLVPMAGVMVNRQDLDTSLVRV